MNMLSLSQGEYLIPRLANNPIIWRELIVRLRRLSSFIYFTLFHSLILGLIVALWWSRPGGRLPSGGEMMEFVYFFGITQAVFVLFLVPAISANSVNLEVERESWDLLRTTPLCFTDILFAKLASSIIYIWIYFFSLLPFYSVFFFFGGVSPTLIFLIFLMLTDCVLVSAIIGIFCSTLFRKPVLAITAAYLLTIAYVLLPIVLSFRVGPPGATPPLHGLLFVLSPLYLPTIEAFGNPSLNIVAPFIQRHQILLHLLFHATLLPILYWLCLKRFPFITRSQSHTRKDRFIQFYGFRHYFRRKTLLLDFDKLAIPNGSNPIYCKEKSIQEQRHRLTNYFYTLLLFSLSLYWMGGFIWSRLDDSVRQDMPWEGIVYTLVALIPLFVVPYSIYGIRGEMDRQTWDLLRTTTLPPGQTVIGKILEGLRLLTWRMGAFFGVIFVFAAIDFFDYRQPFAFLILFPHMRENPFVLVVCLTGLSFVWGLFYLSSGMYFSSISRNSFTAYQTTLVFLLGILLFPLLISQTIAQFIAGSVGNPAANYPIVIKCLFSPIGLAHQYFEDFRLNDPRYPGVRWLELSLFQAFWMVAVSLTFLRHAKRRLQRQD